MKNKEQRMLKADSKLRFFLYRGMMAAICVLACLALKAATWNPDDWDDDGVDNGSDLIWNDPQTSFKASERALVLKQIPSGIELPEESRFATGKNFTIEFWYCPFAPTKGGKSTDISGTFFEYNEEYDPVSYKLYIENGKFKLSYKDNDNELNETFYSLGETKLTTNVNQPKWIHLAITYLHPEADATTETETESKAELKIYVDSTLKQTINQKFSESAVLMVKLGGSFENGFLDEFRYWDDVRSADELKANKEKLQEQDTENLIAYYRFDDGGESIEDFAHLPNFKSAKDKYEANPSDTTIDEEFKYRLDASANGVNCANYYIDSTNPASVDIAVATVWKKGHALWVTGQSASLPEYEKNRDGINDIDDDGLAGDGDSNLDSTTPFVVVRKANSTDVATARKGTDFYVYDCKGQRLWIMGKDGAAAASVASSPMKDMTLTKAAFGEKLANGETDIWNDADEDSDGICCDNNIAKSLEAESEVSEYEKWSIEKYSSLVGKYDDENNDGLINYYDFLLETDGATGDELTPSGDRDKDGLNNYEEQQAGTDPTDKDTDDDGDGDSYEVKKGYNPLDASSSSHANVNYGLNILAGETVTYAGKYLASIDAIAAGSNYPSMTFKLDFLQQESSNAVLFTRNSAIDEAVDPNKHLRISIDADGYISVVLSDMALIKSNMSIPTGKWAHVELIVNEGNAAAQIYNQLASLKSSYDSDGDGTFETVETQSFKVGTSLLACDGADAVLGDSSNTKDVFVDNLTYLWTYKTTSGEKDETTTTNTVNVVLSNFNDNGNNVDNTALPKDKRNVSDTSKYYYDQDKAGKSSKGACTFVYNAIGVSAADYAYNVWSIEKYRSIVLKGDDENSDGLTNYYEFLLRNEDADKQEPNADADGDELVNLAEQELGTDPTLKDSDDDGRNDNVEIEDGTEPRSSFSRKDSIPYYAASFVPGATLKYIPAKDSTYAPSKNFTVEFWFKVDTLTETTIVEVPSIITGIPQYAVKIAADGKVTFQVGQSSLTSTKNISAGVWTHLAAVYEEKDELVDTSISLYLAEEKDGTIKELSADYNRNMVAFMPAEDEQDGSAFIIGSASNTGYYQIDNLRLWKIKRELASIQNDRKNEQSDYVQQNSAYLTICSTFNDCGITAENHCATRGIVYEAGTDTIKYTLPDLTRAGVMNGVTFAERQELVDVVLDTDEDGLPDYWELAYWGTLTKQNGQGDPDDDGLTNIYEYYAGTNPTKKETFEGKSDAELDVDGDGLTNWDEQQYGTHPNNKDTDDDGIYDGNEIIAGSNPLKVEREIDYYVSLPAGGKIEYPAEEMTVSGNFTVSMWLCLNKDTIEAAPTFTVASRVSEQVSSRYQFKLEVVNGRLRFLVGTSFVMADKSLVATDDNMSWIKVTASRTSTALKLTVTQDISRKGTYAENGDISEYSVSYYATGILESNQNVIIGSVDNSVAFGVDEFELTSQVTKTSTVTTKDSDGKETTTTTTSIVDSAFISSSFDDLGESMENSATDEKLTLVSGKSFINQEVSAGKPNMVAEDDYTGDGTVVNPRRHVWFLKSNKATQKSDTDEDGIPDWWEELYGLDPKDAGDATGDIDEDELNNLYEYLCGCDPTTSITEGRSFYYEIDGEMTRVWQRDGKLYVNAGYAQVIDASRYDDAVIDWPDSYVDYDGDYISNGDEQYIGSRPDKRDTDDDGADDGVEEGYAPESGYVYLSSPILSLQQPNDDMSGIATASEIGKILRLNGSNSMTVASNPDHSSNTLTVMFWMRAGMQEDGELLDDESAVLPSAYTTFLGRTIDNGAYNYRFDVNKGGVRFWVSKKSTSVTPTGVAIEYKPAGGLKPNTWYLISGVLDLEAASPYIYMYCFEPEASESETSTSYKGTTVKGAFTVKNGSNISDEGNLIVGKQSSTAAWQENLVVDIDMLTIWSDAKEKVVIESATGDGSTSVSGFNTNMVSRYVFDDGGATCEDFLHTQDWWKNWKHAGVLADVAEPVIAGGMIKDGTLSDMSSDTDHDGLPDDWELYFFGSLQYDGNDDPDDDGMTNWQEYTMSESFRASDCTDLDYGNTEAWLNPNDTDTDGDGLPDNWEFRNGLNPLDDSDANEDADEDELSNLKEYYYGTEPNKPDTDEDGLPDGWEVKYMFVDAKGAIVDPSMDPLNASGNYGANGDPDGDDIKNIDEYTYGTDPTIYDSPDKDTDKDGLTDVDERKYGTDPLFTDSDDDEYDDYVEMVQGTEGYNSQSKPAISSGTGFAYEGNLVAQIMKRDGNTRGCLTVPEAGDAERLGFGSWTVEARVRLRNLLAPNMISSDKDVYLIRRSFSKTSYAANESVEDTEAWNYAIGLRLKSGSDKVYPFVSWKALGDIERRVNSYTSKSDTGVALSLDSTGDGTTYQTDWVFISGSYDASTQTLKLYINGEKIREQTIGTTLTSSEQCPNETSKLGNGKEYVAYVKMGENFDVDETSKLLLDEVRVWGAEPGTIETETGYVSDFTRTDGDIANAVNAPVAPAIGVYDAGIGNRYDIVGEDDYMIDTNVSDGTWSTASGTEGTRVVVAYEDRNHNNKWDKGEDIWRDRTVSQAEKEDGTESSDSDSSSSSSSSSKTPTSYHYDEDYDVKLATGGNGWQCGTAYSYTDAAGDTVKVTADESLDGNSLAVYYNDLNGNGVIDATDDFWTDYTEEDTSKYQAVKADWAARMGLALYYRFDDGGGSMEDYAWNYDWRSTPVWKHSIRPTGLEGTWPPESTDIGGIDNDYQFVTEQDGDGYAWVINAIESPTTPEIEIQTLSDERNSEGEIEYCYRPVTNSSDKNLYDLLTAKILEESADPEGGTITYKYWWLDSAYYVNANKLYGSNGGPVLTYDDGLVASNTQDGLLPDGALLSTDTELDLYAMRNDVSVGTRLQLAVVAISSTGKSSDVAIRTITVTNDETYLPPNPFTSVSFTAETVKDSVPQQGTNLTVTLQLEDYSSVNGSVVLEWYKNGVLYDTKTDDAASSVSFTLQGKVMVGNEIDYITSAGSVWAYKAYYAEARVEEGKVVSSKQSRRIPPFGEITGDFDYMLIGEATEEELEDESALAGNDAPTIPTTITITPTRVDENTTMIATASGSVDPNGDSFSYIYEWYVNGKKIANETMPIFPYQDGTRTTTTTTTTTTQATDSSEATTTSTTTTTTIAATTFSAGDRIQCYASAMDIYGAQSGVRISSAITVEEEMSEGLYGMEAYAYEYNNTWKTATRILPKETWTDLDDDNVQEHYFYDETDFDWFYFVVNESEYKGSKMVKFETNAGMDEYGMYNEYHLVSMDSMTTQLDLYYKKPGSDKLERVLHSTGYANGNGKTTYARFEKVLEPGEYYVSVGYVADPLLEVSAFSNEVPYYAHLGIEEISELTAPTAPTSVKLTPEVPGVTEDLVCEASGSINAYNTDEGVIYHYVWYRNGVLVPFGSDGDAMSWATDNYLISQSKNHASAGYGDPNVMPSEYTLPGQTWYVVVYAEDSVGYSEGVKSNEVTIQSSSWDMSIGVTKTYKSGIGPVEWEDQKVTFGWRGNATFGFDPAYDSAIPELGVPGSPLALGRMYSIGLDNEYGQLATDMRPYGDASSWFIMVEVGDDTISSIELSWKDANKVPIDSTGDLTITRMRKSVAGTFQTVVGTTQYMAETSSISISEDELNELQVDENGQRYVVFRISLGAPDSMQQVTLNPGWNMISLAVTPLDNGVDDVFANGSTKYYSGVVYEYVGGQYVAATNIRATRGYWVYATKKAEFVVYGDQEDTSISLNKGWNIAGPVYDIPDFKTMYANYTGIVPPEKISKFINYGDGTSGYKEVKTSDGKGGYIYPLQLGEAYWIYAEEAVELPLIPNED